MPTAAPVLQFRFHRPFRSNAASHYSAALLAAAQLIFLWNEFSSVRRGRVAEANAWEASTVEWASGAAPCRIGVRALNARGNPAARLPSEWETVGIGE